MNENNEFPYIRVRTAIYKKIQKPLLSGDFIEWLSPWSLDVIRQDYGKKWIELYGRMSKYDGFCNMPVYNGIDGPRISEHSGPVISLINGPLSFYNYK